MEFKPQIGLFILLLLISEWIAVVPIVVVVVVVYFLFLYCAPLIGELEAQFGESGIQA